MNNCANAIMRLNSELRRVMRHLLFACAALIFWSAAGAGAQTPGEVLPPWSPGVLDIHRISTGKGDAVLYVFPDRTAMLVDPAANLPKGPRFTTQRPNATRTPGEWIARYVAHVLPGIAKTGLDYALLTHFHGDHMGGYDPEAPDAPGGYKLYGLTEVGERIPFRIMIDRGWPEYDYPGTPGASAEQGTLENYRKFIAWQAAHKGLRVERFRPGRNDQIVMRHAPEKYPDFEIRNIAANGELWTGEGAATRRLYPPPDQFAPGQMPHENMCSIVFRLRYGNFRYYAGGDIPGVVPKGKPAWFDVETPVAKVVGPVDAAVLNHHAVSDTGNTFFFRTLRPRVLTLSFWSETHLNREVLARLLSPETYPGPRDIFSTNMVEKTQAANPDIAKLKSVHGHVVIRVAPGGREYRVIILDDTAETFKITAVHGPYTCD